MSREDIGLGRREFLTLPAALAVSGMVRNVVAAGKGDGTAPPRIDRDKVKPRNRRPYSGVDWKSAHQINGTTHIHQHADVLDVVRERNIGFLTLSNYYPSAPVCPLSECTFPRGTPVSDWPVMVNGKRVPGPFDWNKIVSQWEKEIPEKDKKAVSAYPFKARKAYHPWQIPKGLLEAPNAEHHGFLFEDGSPVGNLHICSPGSAFASGTFDAGNLKKTVSHGYCFASGEFWGTAIDRMIDALVCPDGGGVTINHPSWTRIGREFLLKLIDWDPRVLGIEVLENSRNSEHYWDWVLSTGRQCFGFFVPDHGLHKKDFGVCVLVVPERTVEACLKAYRNGDFYGAAHGLGELRFTSIVFDGASVRATTDKPARFEVITARGVRKTVEGTGVEWTCPKENRNDEGPSLEVFARIRATALDGSGERLFTQAGMLVPERRRRRIK